jgi:hypothetical protein
LPEIAAKVIAFDSWTGGAANIERLVDAFAAQGLEIFLVHLGSWGHDPGRPEEEKIGRLLVRDISYYGGESFDELLRRERPSAVLFLSMQAFAHRAFNRYCSSLGIPTLHLYHGLVNVQSTSARRLNPLNVRSQAALAFSRLGKNMRLLWPAYARALLKTKAGFHDWTWFLYDVWRQISGRQYSGPAAPDTKTSACCVYTQADVSHATARYRMDPASVFPVGNPDLVRFGLSAQVLGSCLRQPSFTNPKIMYIDTALIEAGAVFDDASDFARHLAQTKTALAGAGYRLTVKLHPAHYRTGVPELLDEARIDLCSNDQFVATLKECSAAITEPSSAGLIPALLGLPLLLARYGKLREQGYGEVLVSYPRARTLHSLAALPALLEDTTDSTSLERTGAWLTANAGPLPAEQMAERVAHVARTLIS